VKGSASAAASETAWVSVKALGLAMGSAWAAVSA